MTSSSMPANSTQISMASLVVAFVAGFIAVPIFHQIALEILNIIGLPNALLGIPAIPIYDMSPTKPLGVPALLSISFWGGVWGVVFALTLPRWFTGTAYWVASAVIGGVALTLVYIFVVVPLKSGGLPPIVPILIIGFIVNAAWGIGWAIFVALIDRLRAGAAA
ncbi:MAG TPA: hypothetical protein VET85_04715 [Stellaceae bacterium]|nr:hypothetical protein [Stellaceae bacterium]